MTFCINEYANVQTLVYVTCLINMRIVMLHFKCMINIYILMRMIND